ncbi:MAG TPA: flagellar basal body protein [Jatrophihabitans sp.]|uniref:flagellar basal body rod protein FlgB n=1 Tax=Jatrophihabitans sp. TaxID=1932789 RepID=UPI002E0A9E08|nr:flagellar basal body protein [Jatrophihabitans sp.]
MFDDVAAVSLQTAIAGLSARQQMTAQNIANVETPGYTAHTVSFEQSLASAIAGGDPSQAVITTGASTAQAGLNGNNVSIGDEMVTATKTGLQEKLVMGGITAKYELYSTVLKG